MVKIINTIGDFKRGAQGPGVYQGHYGQQVRRVRAPKRAPPSGAQLKHRDLFLFSLAWKKTLTTHDKAWLKYHAIVAGVIDSYGIPLAWHHYADKIGLSRALFTRRFIGVPPSLVLEVYHPALLEVILTREGEGGKSWGNLSSLEGEYITSELHLDVQPEDVIQVKTLPGIVYSYTVPGKKVKEMIYVELWPSMPHWVSELEVWEDWDISALVSADAIAVDVMIYHAAVEIGNNGAREDGSERARLLSMIQFSSAILPCNVAQSKTIEVFAWYTGALFRIVGYWKPG